MSTKIQSSALHTPQGYRIDGQYKYLLIPSVHSGSELRTESTECEMELWEIRSDMLAALKEIGCIARTLAVALDGESGATDDSLAEIRKLCQDVAAKAEGHQ